MRNTTHRFLGFVLYAFAFLAFAAFGFILQQETKSYRTAIETWAERDLAARTQLATEAIRDSLASGDFARIRAFADAQRVDGLRLTVLTRNGGMFFDSDSRAAGSRATAPEVMAARERGEGCSLRDSTTTGGRLLYCARRAGEDFIVRLALPYETVVAPIRAHRPGLILAALVGASGILLVMLFTFRLIARNRELARERDSQEKLLAETLRLAEFRRDFIANVSHELKTPLTGILGAVEMLESPFAAELPESDRQELFKMLKRESSRLDALAKDILSLARLEDDSQTRYAFAPTELSDVLASAADRVRPHAEKAGIRLEIAPAPSIVLDCDARLVEQALVNLADNAIRHSGSSDVILSLSTHGDHAVFTVSDHGTGLTLHDQARIFERFYRVDKSHNRDAGGTGLGLAIVKHVATLHGGDATVASQPGNGCVFTLTISKNNSKANNNER